MDKTSKFYASVAMCLPWLFLSIWHLTRNDIDAFKWEMIICQIWAACAIINLKK